MAHTVPSLPGASSSGKEPSTPSPTPQRKFQLEPELEPGKRQVRLGTAGGVRSRAFIQGIELGKVTAKQPRTNAWRDH